uniref:Uncharacterized protein n=1 Tax=Anguilla anguilla TaxID=7936 RepID=A0A0E9UAF8_ANGAN
MSPTNLQQCLTSLLDKNKCFLSLYTSCHSNAHALTVHT